MKLRNESNMPIRVTTTSHDAGQYLGPWQEVEVPEGEETLILVPEEKQR
jgi:hypothetical protein